MWVSDGTSIFNVRADCRTVLWVLVGVTRYGSSGVVGFFDNVVHISVPAE